MEPKVSSLEKFTTLFFLQKKAMHGYELMKQLNECLKMKSSSGKIYPFLSFLEKKKLVTVKIQGNRKKKVYSLTSKGKKFVKELIERFEPIVEASLEEKIHECIHCGCKVFGKTFKKNGKIFCCKSCCQESE